MSLAFLLVGLYATAVMSQGITTGLWTQKTELEHCILRNDFGRDDVLAQDITYTVVNSTSIHLRCFAGTNGYSDNGDLDADGNMMQPYWGVRNGAIRTCYNNSYSGQYVMFWNDDTFECARCGPYCHGCNEKGSDMECDTCPINAKDDNDTSTPSTCVCNDGYFNKWNMDVWEDTCRPLTYFCNLYADPWALNDNKHAQLTIDVNGHGDPDKADFSCAGDVGLSGPTTRTCRVHNEGWWFDWDDMTQCEDCGWGCTDCDSISGVCNQCIVDAKDDGTSSSTCMCYDGYEKNDEETQCVQSYCTIDLENGDVYPNSNNGTGELYSFYPDETTVLDFSCDEGHYNKGSKQMTCDKYVDGARFSGYDNPPDCRQCGVLCRTCENTDRPCDLCPLFSSDNGDSRATCRCDDGYRIDGPFSCVKAECPVAVLENGVTSPADGRALTNENVTFTCGVGFKFVGVEDTEITLNCLADRLSDTSSWSGEFPECVDINECDIEVDFTRMGTDYSVNGACEHNCINSQGSYECGCNVGWSLSGTKMCQECDYMCEQCDNGKDNQCTRCAANYKAASMVSSVCDCDSGWELEDVSNDASPCVDIDECQTNNGGCEQTCVNTAGSYECLCSDTFSLKPDNLNCRKCGAKCNACEEGDTGRCTECILNAVNYPIKTREMLAAGVDNSSGTVNLDDLEQEWFDLSNNACRCGTGWEDDENDELLCIDTNECVVENNGSCQVKCVNIPGSFRCACELDDYINTSIELINAGWNLTNCTTGMSDHLLPSFDAMAKSGATNYIFSFWTTVALFVFTYFARYL